MNDFPVYAAVWQWMITPWSGDPHHALPSWAAWHARTMVLGWGLLLPLGAVTARFFKVLPGQGWPRRLDHKAWWHLHRGLQWGGVVAMSIGLWLACGATLGMNNGTAVQLHRLLGWSLCTAGWLQVLGGLARGSKGGPTAERLRGDHYDMTRRRLLFERLHKSLGWLAIVMSIAAIALGLFIADAPRWMALSMGVWWSALLTVFTVLQLRGHCIDTYQAIWGPDPSLPGSRVPPIGWGVRRYNAASWRAGPGKRCATAPAHRN